MTVHIEQPPVVNDFLMTLDHFVELWAIKNKTIKNKTIKNKTIKNKTIKNKTIKKQSLKNNIIF